MSLFYTVLDCFKRPYKAFHMILRMIYFSYQSQKKMNKVFARVFLRSLKLYIKDGFLPEEAYQYGFLSDSFTYGSQSKYTSKKKMMSIQRKINPISWELLTEDKGIFYLFCEKLNIPTPKLYGLIFKDSPSWSFIDSKIKTRDDWNDFSINLIPSEFVIKPARGCYGRSIKIFQRVGETFIDEKNVTNKPGEIYDYMLTDRLYDCFIIQERLHNHIDFLHLSNTDYLQTIRIITHIDKDSNIRILYAYLKPIVGNNIVDNQNYGRTGNLLAKIDLDKGMLQNAVFMASNPYGIEKVTNHPDTGVCFHDFPIPKWADACDLAIATAKQFLPIRTIGWDVAITPDGPYIIEGNITYDPPKFGDMDRILSELNT